jgi:hypothetical protein
VEGIAAGGRHRAKNCQGGDALRNILNWFTQGFQHFMKVRLLRGLVHLTHRCWLSSSAARLWWRWVYRRISNMWT